MSSVAVSFHFVASFLLTIAALGGFWAGLGRSEFAPSAAVARFCFAGGWLLVAAGEMLHGAEIVSAEPHLVTVSIRSAGYVLLLAALAASLRARRRAFGLLLGAVGMLAVTEVAFVASPQLHESSTGLLWALVHSFRLAAACAAGAWLWNAIRTSIQARFIAIFILLLLVVVLAISSATSQLFAGNIMEEAIRRAERDGEVQARTIQDQVDESVSRSRQLAELESIRTAVAARDPVLAPTAQRLQGPGGAFDTADFMAFFDPQGAVLAISAEGPDAEVNLATSDALSLAGTEVVRSALARRQAGSVDALGDKNISLIGAYPVLNPPGVDPAGSPPGLAGAVAVGRIINARYLAQLQRAEDQEVSVITRESVLGTTAESADGVLLTERSAAARVFEDAEVLVRRAVIGNEEFFAAYVPLQQSDNDVVGALVLSRRSGALANALKDVSRTVFILALASTVVGVALSYAFASRVTRPIRELTGAAQRVRAGDLNAKVAPEGYDELATLGQSFDEMTASISSLTTDLKKTAEEERRQRSSLETVLHSMADGVIATDESGLVAAINLEAERLLGSSASRALGKPVGDVLKLVDSQDNPIEPAIVRLEAGTERGAVAGSDPAVPVTVNSAQIRDETGRVIGGVALVRDVSGELALEKMKTNFLSNISHELRTPLTPIKGYSDILRRTKVPREKALTFLDGIIEGAERLERIVEMLVDFSAMESGKLVVHKAPLDLDKMTSELLDRWGRQARGHRFQRKGFHRLPAISADRKLIRMAVGELIDNAVKFSPTGGAVTLTAASENGRNPTIKISVSDNGIGITADQMEVITESFHQADPSATRAFGGLGLGLAYVKRVAESHGGDLEVKSKPGKGSTFTLVLPKGASS